MTTAYSAFFSSGLLAPPQLYPKSARTPPSSPGLLPSSPGLVPSPRSASPVADDSDIEDFDINMDTDEPRRFPTPTPSSVGGRSRSGSVVSVAQHAQQAQKPRLRRRRSSINVGTSPMNVIKSPQRNAGSALQLQQRLSGSIGRSRGGSLSFLGLGPPSTEPNSQNGQNVASQSTSLLGRMRSGSVGGAAITNLFRPRRAARRLASVPAPVPPPTAPLPALPTDAPKHIKSNSLFHNTSIFSNPRAIFSQVASVRQPLNHHQRTGGAAAASSDTQTTAVKPTKGRERAFSCTKGVTVDSAIDEEMREN